MADGRAVHANRRTPSAALTRLPAEPYGCVVGVVRLRASTASNV